MDNNKIVEHFIHVLELYAKSKGWKLSQYANKIVSRCILLYNGHCPWDNSRSLCPCEQHESEIQKDGHCHCTLFERRDLK